MMRKGFLLKVFLLVLLVMVLIASVALLRCRFVLLGMSIRLTLKCKSRNSFAPDHGFHFADFSAIKTVFEHEITHSIPREIPAMFGRLEMFATPNGFAIFEDRY